MQVRIIVGLVSLLTIGCFSANAAESLKSIRNKAELGIAYYQGVLADYYRRGARLPQDWSQSLHWAKRAAEQQHPFGWYTLGKLFWDGLGVQPDRVRAEKWFRKAFPKMKQLSDSGNRLAQLHLAFMYRDGLGVAANPEAADRLFITTAVLGDPFSQFVVAQNYRDGLWVERDVDEAIKWFRRAARKNHSESQYHLGRLYTREHGAYVKPAIVVAWFQRSAENGYGPAQTALGRLYLVGEGVPQSYSNAFRWFRRAAEQGNIEGAYWLGHLYRTIPGKLQNKRQAEKWIQRAAQKGHEAAIEDMKYFVVPPEAFLQLKLRLVFDAVVYGDSQDLAMTVVDLTKYGLQGGLWEPGLQNNYWIYRIHANVPTIGRESSTVIEFRLGQYRQEKFAYIARINNNGSYLTTSEKVRFVPQLIAHARWVRHDQNGVQARIEPENVLGNGL